MTYSQSSEKPLWRPFEERQQCWREPLEEPRRCPLNQPMSFAQAASAVELEAGDESDALLCQMTCFCERLAEEPGWGTVIEYTKDKTLGNRSINRLFSFVSEEKIHG